MQRGKQGSGGRSSETAEMTPDRVFDLLESSRRRHALAHLSERSTRIPLDELATIVAARENDEETSDVDEEVKEQVQLSLFHVHLPKLEAAGLVEFDRGDVQTVELTGDLGPLEPSLDIDQEQGERREYYTT